LELKVIINIKIRVVSTIHASITSSISIYILYFYFDKIVESPIDFELDLASYNVYYTVGYMISDIIICLKIGDEQAGKKIFKI
jgi:hypothetical protein